MNKITMLHTVKSVYSTFEQSVRDSIKSPLEITSLVDEFLVTNAEKYGFFPPVNRQKLYLDLLSAKLEAPDIIVVTCSSLTPFVTELKSSFDTPIICIDDEMCYQAVKKYKKIGVIATAPTTIQPTLSKLESEAKKQNKEIEVDSLLVAEAMTALKNGDVRTHDSLLAEKATQFSSYDCILLAQASMASAKALVFETTGRPVLTSPQTCIEKIKRLLEND